MRKKNPIELIQLTTFEKIQTKIKNYSMNNDPLADAGQEMRNSKRFLPTFYTFEHLKWKTTIEQISKRSMAKDGILGY